MGKTKCNKFLYKNGNKIYIQMNIDKLDFIITRE